MPRFHYIAGAGLALLASLGCAGRAPERGTGVEPDRTQSQVAREQPGTPATTPVRAGFQYAAGTATYVVTTEATIIELDSVASGPRTFREVARMDVTIARSENVLLVTSTGTVEGTTSTGIVHPFVDTLRQTDTGTIAEPTLPICGRDTVPPVHLVTLLPSVPLELREGARWQRRQVYAICQGQIPMRVERTDSYVVSGRALRMAGTGVTLTRNSSLAYSGSGVEGQHNVRVVGSGSGQATVVLDASAGRLVSVVEENVSEIDVIASGRTRRFSQKVARTVERQPGS